MELNYKIYGSGRPVIILHGLFGMLDNWHSFARQLGAQYQVITIDQRDHGKSPHTELFNYKVLSQDLYDFIKAHNLNDVILVGHSMGGRTIMQFALDHPSMIDKMVVVDMGIKQYRGGHEYIIEALQSLNIGEIKSRKEVDLELAKYIDNESVRLFLMKNLAKKQEGGYRWKMNLDLISRSYSDIMNWRPGQQQSAIPVLFVRGTKSQYILESDKTEIQLLFTNASFVDIDSGHWIHAEKPQELHDELINFF